MTNSKSGIIKSVSVSLSIFAASSVLNAADSNLITKDHFPIDEVEINRSQKPLLTSYAESLSSVKESVVSVYTANKMRVRKYTNPQEEMLRRFFGEPPRSQEEDDSENFQRVPAGQGSGVIVSSDGYILTNNHVISDRSGGKVDEVYVTLSNGEEFEAEIVGYDEKTDIAVLKIEADELPTAKMANSDNLEIGDIVFAIGNPMGVGKTVTMGIVSATSKDLDILGTQGYESFIQTDASINPGNSGGALVDANGRLIGINTAIISQSGGNIGIGFAVPIKLARSILISLAIDGEVRRGLLGIVPGKIDSALAEYHNLDSAEGAIVNQLTEDLPAAKAGVKVGDIILKIDGQKIKDDDHLRLTVAGIRPGTEVEMELLRDGKLKKIKVILADFDDPYGTGASSNSEILQGVTAEEVNDDLRSKFKIADDLSGIVITDIDLNSPHSRTLATGLLIIEINGKKIKTIKDAKESLKVGMNQLFIHSRGNYGFVAVRIHPKE